GVPAIAFSLVARARPLDFSHAARFARGLTATALQHPLPPRLVLNVNIPSAAPPRGWAVTRLGRHSYGNQVVENTDPRGRRYYWIGGGGDAAPGPARNDRNWGADGNQISLPPALLHL